MLRRLPPRWTPFLKLRPCVRSLASWTQDVSKPSNLVQSYVSRSDDPFLNLSIEHYLLQHSPPESCVLFLYANRPSIILGRNQNPWLEVNLGLLNGMGRVDGEKTRLNNLDEVLLVRRRSGGGTVFHDEGNVNWSVISPPADFTRDKHAEMVVKALRGHGIERARVNERHDIVVDQGMARHECVAGDLHRTPYTSDGPSAPRSIKVSGSAYKLTRRRALHHGTCLLCSPNLAVIPKYLRSPAAPFIKAKGVESVSSPVGNIGLDTEVFKEAVLEAFSSMYGGEGSFQVVGDEAMEEFKISEYMEETKTLDWTFGQTPQFTFSTYATHDDDRERPRLPRHIPQTTQIFLGLRRGEIIDSQISMSSDAIASKEQSAQVLNVLKGRQFHTFGSWRDLIDEAKLDARTEDIVALCSWLDFIIPTHVKIKQ